MEGLRPPSYRATVASDALSTAVTSSGSLYSTDDLFSEPSPGFSELSPGFSAPSPNFSEPSPGMFSRHPETTDVQSRPGPRPNQTAPMRLGGSSLPLTTVQPFPLEKQIPVEKQLPVIPRPRTSENICYAFSQTAFNSMALMPTVHVGEDQPQYRIVVHMNCFMPLSHTTKVCRFWRDRGKEKVGEFEMGISTVPSKVQVGSYGGLISSVLSKSGSRSSGSWFWNPLLGVNTKYGLRWDYDKRPCVCRSTDRGDKPILAKFTSPFGLDSNSEVAMLEVTPAGQELFDHILVSLLIIERKRLTPDRENALKPLFS